MSHPITEESLRRFAARTASPEEGRTIVAHLLKGCSSCAKRLRSLERPGIPDGAYDAMFARLERASASHGSTKVPGAAGNSRELLAELDAQPEARQEILVRNSRRYWSPELAELLCERSYFRRFEDPRRVLHWARLAVLIGEHFEEPGSSREALADVRALCFAQLGTALRISGDLEAADQSMMTARNWMRRGTGNAELRAKIYGHLASLRTNQFRCNEAEHLYAQAAEIWRDLGKPHMLAKILIGQAIAVLYRGDPDSALSLLMEAMPKIDGSNDPRMTFAACHAVIRCQIELGQIEEASLRWVELRSLYSRLKDPILHTRGKWLEGRLMIGQGMISAGLKLLQDAREELAQKGLEYDAALVALEIAGSYMGLGRSEEVRRLLAEILPVFRNRKVERSALASVLFLGRVVSCVPSASSP